MPKFLTQSKETLADKYKLIKKLEEKRLADCFKNPTSSEWSYTASISNKERNRYVEVLPFNFNRIKLKLKSSKFSDYINASKINLDIGSKPGNYIATQGPTSKTYRHFWNMCLQQTKSQILIVMVTPIFESGIEKCFKYWTENDFLVRNEENDGFSSDLLFRFKGRYEESEHFQVLEWELIEVGTGSKRQVLHFYYDSWEDHSAPETIDPILDLSKSVHKLKSDDPEEPIFVHCSAGVGRSGTFITIDYFLTCCRSYLEPSKPVRPATSISDGERSELITPVNNHEVEDPIYNIVLRLRQQRVLMVQKFAQFLFIYDTVKKYYVENYLNSQNIQ